jgi:putative flippase GtrA
VNSPSRAHKEFARYVIVGTGSNVTAYLLYLLLTANGMAHTLAMSLLYGACVLQTFVFNRRWTFGHRGARPAVFFRYCLTYAVGYVLNVLALLVLVDRCGYSHQVVQGVMILCLALAVFLSQKYWVFQSGEPRSGLQSDDAQTL